MSDCPLEIVEQVSFVNWFERTYPDVMIHSIPNGLHLSHRQRQKAVAEGMRSGPSDLHVPSWHLYIEMKRQRGGSWSKEQKAYKTEVEMAGGTYLLCRGCADAIAQVEKFKERVLTARH